MKTNRFLFILAIAALGTLPLAAPAAGNPSDAELTKRVKSALSATIGVRAREIEIIALGGVVSLYGNVYSIAAREGAELAVERTPGVKAVSNNLTVVGGSRARSRSPGAPARQASRGSTGG